MWLHGVDGKGAQDDVSSGLVRSWFLGCIEVKEQSWKAVGTLADGNGDVRAAWAVSACASEQNTPSSR